MKVFLTMTPLDRDDDPFRGPVNHAIPSGHTYIALYLAIEEHILRIVRTTQHNYALTLGLRGTSIAKAKPTILLSCSEPETLDFTGLDLSAFDIHLTRLKLDYYGVTIPYDCAYYPEVPCGVSISLRKGSPGAFGGYFRDKKKPEIMYGLTCGHVLAKAVHDDPVFQPADDDEAERMRDLREDKTKLETRLRELQHLGEEFKSRRQITERSLKDVENQLHVLEELEKTNGCLFGKFINGEVHVAKTPSGRRWSSDWAIFAPEMQRVSENNVMRSGAGRRDVIITELGAVQEGISVKKYGRRTGFKTGTVNALKCHVRLEGAEEDTTEWPVFGIGGDEFALKGDSGAWVVSEDDELIGYVVAGSDHLGFSYISDINLILERVREVMGGLELELVV